MSSFYIFIVLVTFISLIHSAWIDAYSHKPNEEIKIAVDSLNSIKTQIPFDYYFLNICAPEDKLLSMDNWGEIWMGSKKYYTNYAVNIQKSEYCKILCQKQIYNTNYEAISYLIKNDYSLQFYLDNLPSGLANSVDLFDDNPKLEVQYNRGIPWGYPDNNQTVIYNHYRIFVHLNSTEVDKYQIVGFAIEPFSILQKNTPVCQSNSTSEIPLTPFDLLDIDLQTINKGDTILFTYDVVFRYSQITFASRFDHYNYTNKNIHWLGWVNANIMVLVLTFWSLLIFTRAIKNDIQIYNTQITSDEIIDEYGWKQISNDVFRRPVQGGLLCAFFGSGIQIFIMIFYTLCFAVLGFFKPEARGSWLTMMVMVFIFMGVISGYCSSRLLKIFHERNWLKCSIHTAVIFPGFCFMIWVLINWFYRLEGSNVGLEFKQIFSIVVLWVCCSAPLVLLGSFIGAKQKTINTPGKINPVPSAIPYKPWYFHIKFSIWITGLPSFAAIFIELIYIMSALWKRELYFWATFIMLALIVLILTSSQIGMWFTYVNLCKGDHHWWWKCFFVSASPVVYMILYSIYYFFTLSTTRLSAIIIYFGIMSLISFVVFFSLRLSWSVMNVFIFEKNILDDKGDLGSVNEDEDRLGVRRYKLIYD